MADLTITNHMKIGDTVFLDYTDDLWVELWATEHDAYTFSTSLGKYKVNLTSEDVFDILAYFPAVREIRRYKKGSMHCSYFYRSRSNSV